MNNSKQYLKLSIAIFVTTSSILYSCKKDGNPNNLPSVDPSSYVGKIDGYTSSDEVYPERLTAYWAFDNNNNEIKTGTAPTAAVNASVIDGGVRGKALSLNSGYLYYATQFPQFRTDTMKSWSISLWTKIKNNGSKRTMLFQIARPTVFAGNINFILNTQQYPATNDSTLRINPTFTRVNITSNAVGTEDNLNSGAGQDKINLNDWVHIVLTYDINTGTFHNYANGRRVGNFPNRGTTNLFRSFEPSEVIIGSNYNGIPGKAVNADVTFAPMTGQLDEIRVWNNTLPEAVVIALYNLGKAGK